MIGKLYPLSKLLFAQGGHYLLIDIGVHAEEQAAGFPCLQVTVDEPARRIWGLYGDASQRERHAVEHTGMHGAMG